MNNNGIIEYKESFFSKIKSYFRNYDKQMILICSDAAKEGHNLQFCHNLIHYDLPFAPAVIGQRNGRIYRKGQQETPLCFYMLLGHGEEQGKNQRHRHQPKGGQGKEGAEGAEEGFPGHGGILGGDQGQQGQGQQGNQLAHERRKIQPDQLGSMGGRAGAMANAKGGHPAHIAFHGHDGAGENGDPHGAKGQGKIIGYGRGLIQGADE